MTKKYVLDKIIFVPYNKIYYVTQTFYAGWIHFSENLYVVSSILTCGTKDF